MRGLMLPGADALPGLMLPGLMLPGATRADPAADDESDGVREGHLAELFAQAGLGGAQVSTLTVQVRQASFEQWWEPFTLSVGPAGAYLASLAGIVAPCCANPGKTKSPRPPPNSEARHSPAHSDEAKYGGLLTAVTKVKYW